MQNAKKDFDKEAAAWDEVPARVKLADDVARAVREAVALAPSMDVLDFGCGTGLLTLRLQPHVGSVTGLDSSPGMLARLEEKVAELGIGNVRTALVDVSRGEAVPGRYDLIVSSMVLHHVEDVPGLLARLRPALAPGGSICLADLDSEHGLFHDDATGVMHDGFERAELRAMLEAAGFADVRDTTAATVTKPGADKVVRDFTVFLLTARAG
ncbi:pedicted SAM-dependent methyltransferase [Desulfovibrio sp. X2]|uniref:class I SAM-dependent methyltransferase n=1 Tax=Desulfovibrio sp. X2 TaxID=941449 RepID=UPI000358B028|nr:class I SAM-dependent methyltransferase [Desulfovibrio sp. X2]EPR37536.1 pedicted SAM-dependent methyltransferase [Desulfovibrio sp. X2]